jgi:hypothetical protein
MTPQEFKAWFEGFTEAFDRLPTKAQWARVKDRVAEIDGKPVTERVFVERYRPLYYDYRPYWAAYSAAGNMANANAATCLSASGPTATTNAVFNSTAAMLTLGRAEAQSLAA